MVTGTVYDSINGGKLIYLTRYHDLVRGVINECIDMMKRDFFYYSTIELEVHIFDSDGHVIDHAYLIKQ